MTSPKKGQTPGQFEQILDMSNIEQDPLDRLQTQVARLQDQLKQVKDELAQKKKLLDIQKRTNEAMEQQQRTLRARSTTQEERIRSLQAQLRNRRSQNALGSESPESGIQLQRLKSQESGLKEQLSAVKKDFQIQRSRNKDLQSLNKKITGEVESLKNQIQELKEQNSGRFQSSRDLDMFRLQLEQEKQTTKRLTQKVSSLQRENKELNTKLKNAQNLPKPSPVVQTKVVQGPAKIVEVVSKEAEAEIKKLQAQVQELKQQINVQKEKMKKSYEKQITNLKAQANQANNTKETLRLKVGQLMNEIQNLRSGNLSQSQMFPSQINLNSRIHDRTIEFEEQERVNKHINAEELDEDTTIRVHPKNKGIIQALNKHLKSIKQDQVLNLLSLVSTWSEQQMERIELSANELTESDTLK